MVVRRRKEKAAEQTTRMCPQGNTDTAVALLTVSILWLQNKSSGRNPELCDSTIFGHWNDQNVLFLYTGDSCMDTNT